MTTKSAPRHPSPRQPIYCVVPIEFVQPWDHAKRIRQIKDLQLGNATFLSFTFHVGNRDTDRRKWKRRYPGMAELVDATPKFEARPKHGMARLLPMNLDFWLENMALCKKLGLTVMSWPLKRTGQSGEALSRLTQAGKGCVFGDSIMEEATSMLGAGRSLEDLKKLPRSHAHPSLTVAGQEEDADPSSGLPDSVAELDCQKLHDWYLHPFRREVALAKAMGAKHFIAIEATPQLHLATEAGANVPILELIPYEPIEGLASVRGAAKGCRAPLWGVHTAIGYYQSPTNGWTPERLQIAYNIFYAGGASIFSEPNLAFQNWGLCSAFFSVRASPPIRLGEEERRSFDHPICVRAREVLADHYRFTQFHDRPASGPRIRLGFVMGHLDAYIGDPRQEHVWGVKDPAFAAGPAERTWRHFRRQYDTEPWCARPNKYYWQADPAKPLRFGTPPCGQLDIVPIEAPPDVLQGYKALVFLGWNTMMPAQYDKLKAYVRQGGHLFMSVPHLSRRVRREGPLDLIRNGDLRDLFGVKVTGDGPRVEEVEIVAQSRHKPYALPVGTMYLEGAALMNLELHGARALATVRNGSQPVLTEHKLGRGFAWLLATAEYPGLELDAFLSDVLRTIAEGEQDDIALEGEGVDYAVYDEGKLTTIYLVNKGMYGQPHQPRLCVRGHKIPIRVGGYEMRIAWLFGDWLISPLDRWVKVVSAESVKGRCRLTLEAEAGEHRVQMHHLTHAIQGVEVNGVRHALERNADGTTIMGFRQRRAGRLTTSVSIGTR